MNRASGSRRYVRSRRYTRYPGGDVEMLEYPTRQHAASGASSSRSTRAPSHRSTPDEPRDPDGLPSAANLSACRDPDVPRRQRRHRAGSRRARHPGHRHLHGHHFEPACASRHHRRAGARRQPISRQAGAALARRRSRRASSRATRVIEEQASSRALSRYVGLNGARDRRLASDAQPRCRRGHRRARSSPPPPRAPSTLLDAGVIPTPAAALSTPWSCRHLATGARQRHQVLRLRQVEEDRIVWLRGTSTARRGCSSAGEATPRRHHCAAGGAAAKPLFACQRAVIINIGDGDEHLDPRRRRCSGIAHAVDRCLAVVVDGDGISPSPSAVAADHPRRDRRNLGLQPPGGRHQVVVLEQHGSSSTLCRLGGVAQARPRGKLADRSSILRTSTAHLAPVVAGVGPVLQASSRRCRPRSSLEPHFIRVIGRRPPSTAAPALAISPRAPAPGPRNSSLFSSRVVSGRSLLAAISSTVAVIVPLVQRRHGRSGRRAAQAGNRPRPRGRLQRRL